MKTIAITMGDPAGVGPEIIVKALASDRLKGKIISLVIGDPAIMEAASGLTGSPLPIRIVRAASDAKEGAINLLPIEVKGAFPMREPSAASGELSVWCIKKAVELVLAGHAHALVTAPISKDAIHQAGYPWPGHTEMLAELTKAGEAWMMFAAERLNVILVTIHMPLRSAIEMISKERVLRAIRAAETASRMLSLESPRIVVSGLNPHAGEGSLFGDEEDTFIRPAIESAAREGTRVSGPYPPDVVFKKAVDGEFDIVVAMYHDQGLIPFKMLYFDSGVNMTVGLPIIRTSPDHGTAYDIAWKGVANPSSMTEAILLAERLRLP